MSTPKYPDIRVKLIGESDNAFWILGRVAEALKAAGVPKEEINEYRRQATSGDFDNLLTVTLQWVNEGSSSHDDEEDIDYEPWV